MGPLAGAPDTQNPAVPWSHELSTGVGDIAHAVIDFWKSVGPYITVPLSILGGLLLLLTVVLVCVLGSRVGRLLHASLYVGKPFGRLSAARDILILIREAPVSSLRFQAVQLLIEVAILCPQEAPPLRVNAGSRRAYRRKRRVWRKQHREWRIDTLDRVASLLRGAPNAQVIGIDNVGEINGVREEISRYFSALMEIGHSEPAFFSEIEVRDGFVAPLFLITGLVDTFENWKFIVDPFGRHVAERHDAYEPGFAEQCLFLFDCWLLWGPSIPVCRCQAWRGGHIALQYGYGDENQSVDLMISRADRAAMLSLLEPCLMGTPAPNGASAHVLAGKATVRGVIRWGATLPKEKLNPVQQSIRSAQNKRLVLDLTEAGNLSPAGGTRQDASARYYSAYFWIMFMICNQNNEPLYAGDRKWRNLLPFFEHGNLANAATMAALKRTLVAKTADSIVRILSENHNIGLRYACAFDHDSSDHPNLFPPPQHESLRALLRTRVAQQPELARFVERERLWIGDHGAPTMAGYAGCDLPDIVASYYDEVRES